MHRDLKSANILIDQAGQARICDFGLARHKSLPQNSPSATLPAEDCMMGTYGYMAPEHAASGRAVMHCTAGTLRRTRSHAC